jgi:methyl-accepting chemotaxis protein
MDLRKSFIIDRKFQYKFILKNLMLMVFTFVLIIGVLKWWEMRQLKQGFLLRMPQNSVVVAWAKQNNVPIESAAFLREFLRRAEPYTFFDLLWKPLGLVLVINVIVLIIANIYYSHRIVGPIYRLKKELERKLNGEKINAINFRKKDAFQELADIINKVLALEQKKDTPQ